MNAKTRPGNGATGYESGDHRPFWIAGLQNALCRCRPGAIHVHGVTRLDLATVIGTIVATILVAVRRSPGRYCGSLPGAKRAGKALTLFYSFGFCGA